MELTSNFNKVTRLKCTEIISKLGSINMFLEQRSNRVLMLTGLAYIKIIGIILLSSTRN